MRGVLVVMLRAHHFTVIFLGLPVLALCVGPCVLPYECLTLPQCGVRLAGDPTDEIVFRCSDRNLVCCPPNRANETTRGRTSTEPAIAPTKAPTIHNATHNREGDSPGAGESERKTKEGGSKSKYSSHKNYRNLPATCGATSLHNRITEGEEAALGEFPWMSLIGVRDRSGMLDWICGGTLINKRYVLTAAHCIKKTDNKCDTLVRVGEHNLEKEQDCDKVENICLDPPQDLCPEDIIVHPRWNNTNLKNDIALIRLERNVSESISVSPICLPLDKSRVNVSDDGRFDVAGWGKVEWGSQHISKVLRKATISGRSKESCNICKEKVRPAPYCPITDKQVCIQGWKGVDVCKGDSGGPLMILHEKYYQIGITSFKSSDSCGIETIPSIFTRVESYVDWILDNLKHP